MITPVKFHFRLPPGMSPYRPTSLFQKLGRYLEVRYLYAYKGGSLFQPTSLGVRDDVAPPECVIGQLKYKAGDKDEDEG